MLRNGTLSSQEVDSILDLLVARRGVDLRDYQRPTVERRLLVRMDATASCDGAAYADRLESDPAELDRLVEALLVCVTGFFRDPPVFDALRHRVLPEILGSRSSQEPCRAWVIGTATGEEAYTIAMLLASEMAARGSTSFEVLASDRAPKPLQIARRGFYPVEAIATVPAEFTESFFVPAPGGMRVADLLRERIRFAEHDIASPRLAPKEAIIATFDMVLCRNVLLYMNSRLRSKVAERLATVLRPGGALVLGHAEMLPEVVCRCLEPYPGLDPDLKIFRQKEVLRDPPAEDGDAPPCRVLPPPRDRGGGAERGRSFEDVPWHAPEAIPWNRDLESFG